MTDYNNPLPMPQESTWAEDLEDQKMALYDEYANHTFESFEDFCDRAADQFGQNWVNILSR